jgi:hypothetical protein
MDHRYLGAGLAGNSHLESTKAAFALLLLLLSADLVFIVLHIVYVETGWLRGWPASLEADRGLPEAFQYIKQLWIAIAFATTCWRARVGLYGCWAMVFAFLLVDDAAQLHESVGAWLGREYSLPAVLGLRSDDLGELLFAGAVGLSLLVLVGIAALRADTQQRRICRDTLLLVGALAFLGVLVDMAHVIAYFKGSLWAQVLLLVEDGGEMLVMSMLTAFAFHIAINEGRTQLDLLALARSCIRSLRRSGRSAKPSQYGNRSPLNARQTPAIDTPSNSSEGVRMDECLKGSLPTATSFFQNSR